MRLPQRIIGWYNRAHGIVSVGLRFFNVAGASAAHGEDHRIETHLIPNVLQVALGRRSHVDLFGFDYNTPDGSCVRDYVHVLDIASAHLAALSAPASGFYNIGNGQGYSVSEVIACCRQVTGHAIPAFNHPRRPGDPARLIADARKIKVELGWHPRHSTLREMVESAWKWHRHQPNGYSGK